MAYAGMLRERTDGGQSPGEARRDLEELMLSNEERVARQNQRAFAALGVRPPESGPTVSRKGDVV